MSFYLGKDTDNKGIMHISKGYRTAGELKSGILEDTVFHSDLPYVQYTPYQATLIPMSVPYSNVNYGLSIPETALTAMDSQVFCYLVEHNGVIKLYETYLPELSRIQYPYVSEETLIYESRYLWTSSTFQDVIHFRNPDFRLPAIRLPSPNEVTNVWVVILDTGITHTTNTSETVYVGNGRLDVDGTSLVTYRYITPVPVNSIDPIVYTPAGDPIQFVNAYAGTETSLSVTSDSGRTTIRSGGKEIFDSGIARGKTIFDRITTVVHPKIHMEDRENYDRVLATGMQNGDLFSYTNTFSLSDASYNSIKLGVFRKGNSMLVQTIGAYHGRHGWQWVLYFNIVCTFDGRLLERARLQSYDGTRTNIIETTSYVTHYK